MYVEKTCIPQKRYTANVSALPVLLWIHKAVLNSSILRIKEILNLHTEQQVYRGDVLHYNILKTSEYSLITKKIYFQLDNDMYST
ncbi:hypothetical protein APHNP_0072 [Anaplasma phagocytophilum str. ApNP]|uniref:Uncharacterized protein n=1 Tax=Anaplasma phagocytophilum str. ApNP TaxID=1359153 RepID=A0A0F3NH62_ANAPH|nr:hypothetical protein APHNP_0072 [Anaplasma phagocytophilum str. ApNP]